VDGSNAGGENEGGAAPNGLIADEKNEGGAPPGQGTGPTGPPLEKTKTRENNMKDGLIAEEENKGGAPPLEETKSEEEQKDDGTMVVEGNVGGTKPLAVADAVTEPTEDPWEETKSEEEQKDDGTMLVEGKVGGTKHIAVPGENEGGASRDQPTEPTGESSEKTKAQEEQMEDGSMLVLEILKRQLSCVIDKRYKSVEDYVPKAILTLTPEEVKVIDAKKDLAAEDAIKSVIEMMQEDYGGSEDEDGSTESDDSWKVSRYRYSKDEVKCWFDSLKKCHAYDLGFAADPGTDDKKCWCPCW
jgi:hypothetical protein